MHGDGKRLLITGGFTGLGGAERTLMPLAARLCEAGYELTLLLLRPADRPQFFDDFPGTVTFAPGASLRHKAQTLMQLRRAVAAADLVIATSELTYTYATWLFAALYHKPLIADVQVHLSRWIDDNCHPLHHHLSRLIYPRIPFVRCVSEGLVEDMRVRYKVPEKNLCVIYVPFDTEAIARAARRPVPAEHEHFFSRPVIVASGRFTTQKRFDIAIRALLSLREQHGIDAHLLILGDGELRPQLEAQVRELKLEERVFMPGFADNPHAYVARAQVFLLSSDYEGLPRVLIEALAAGCPAVATDCPSGPQEILEGGRHGLLTRMGEPEEIASALARVLTQDDLAERLRREGPRRAAAFDWQHAIRQYQSLLRQAAAQ
jgi:glycosyltransferase involved in cell wall biosynthesis